MSKSGEPASTSPDSSAPAPGSADIHPTTHIESGAVIGKGATIGPFCVIGANVTIGDNCKLVAHVHIAGHTSIGAGTSISPFASLGTPPQSTSFKGGPTRLVVGEACDIREGVTMNTGTEEGGGVTQVGDRCFFMAYTHVGHDCLLGNDIVMANSAALGGHCIVGDNVFIGGLAAAHQFTRIGANAMVGGMTGLRGDVIPFGLAAGPDGRLFGINIVGMRRRKFTAEMTRTVRAAYRMIFFGSEKMAQRLEQVEAKYGDNEAVAEILAFIRAGKKRPLSYASTGTADVQD